MYKRHADIIFAVCFLSGIFISAFHRLLSFSFFYIPSIIFSDFYFGAFVSAVFGHLKIVAVALILVGFLLGILLIAIIPIEKSF